MSKTTIPTGGITADAIDATLIADDAISEEHLDATAITGHTALAEAPADTDEFLISDGGTLKRIDASYIGGDNTPIFAVTRSGDQSISNNSHTVIQWNSEIFDPDNTFDSSTNYRFTPAVAGYYFLMTQGRIGVQADATKLSVVIRKNGSAIARSIDTNKDNNTVNASTLVLSDTNDYFDVEFYQNTGATRVLSQSTENTFFAGFKIIT